MKYSNTAVRELSAKYRSILKKCAFLNAMVLVSVAVAAPAGASGVPFLAENGQKLSGTYSGYTNTNETLAGVATINYVTTDVSIADDTIFKDNATKKSAGGAIKALNGFTGGDGIKFNGNEAFDGAWGGGAMYIKLANGTTVSPTDSVQLGKNAEFIGNKSNVGGAIALEYGNLTIGEGTIFDSNTATDGDKQRGGAIAVWHDKDGPTEEHSTLTLNGVSFKNNQAGSLGGAIFNEDPNATVTINENSSFKNNTAQRGGAIYNAGTATVNNSEFNKNTATQYGGAIFVAAGTLNVNNSTFTENNGGIIGGAISDVYNVLNTLNINEGTTFTGNYATTGGAIGAYNAFNINGTSNNKVTFKGNHTTAVDDGGGAIVLGAHARTTINNAVFKNNYANLGGAIATRPKGVEGDNAVSEQDKDGHWLTISNSEFRNNRADATLVGGTNGSTYTYDGYNFINGDGGAIWNGFDGSTINGEKHENVITNSSFIGNIAANRGGAIFNKGTLNFTGTNVFSGNKANGELNDIYNVGTINFNGDVTLDGGIVGTGDITFTDTSSLTAKLKTTTIAANTLTTNGATLNLIVDNGITDGKYDFASYTTLDKAFNISDNALYNLEMITEAGDDKGKISVAKKSTSDIVSDLAKEGVGAQQAATISAFADSKGGNPVLSAITEAVQSGDAKAAAKLAEEVAPTTSQTVMGVAQGVNSILSNVAGTRMAAVGRNGGDAFVGGAMWVQGLMNHTKQDSTSNVAGFSADTNGISFGIDGKVNEDLMIGIGYGYTNTDADSGARDIDVDGHNFFAYTEYKPNKWYINGMFNYGFSKYDEQKVAGLQAKYDVNTYAANVMTGYDFDSGITPEVGLRYLVADQDSYNDGAQHVSTDKTDVLTGVVGVKYKADVKAKDWTFTPNLRLAATYDMVSDNSKANVSVIGGGNYQITGKRLNRFGIETGVGIETTYKDWNFSVDYNGGFRKDFQSHTGMLKAKYNF